MAARRVLALVTTAVLTGCGSDTAESSRRDTIMRACGWPAEADTYVDETYSGCRARSMLQVCQVPSGSVFHADTGMITTPSGEVVEGTCMNQCTPTEFSLTCTSGSMSGPIPAPAQGLTCRVIPLPTPQGLVPYCCTCTS